MATSNKTVYNFTPQQEQTQFHRQHKEATESVATKSLQVTLARTAAARINNVYDQAGDLFFNRNGRRLDETASQTATGAAADGILWVRSADSKLIYTDDTDADTDLTDVGLGATLTRGNDAVDQNLTNLNSVDFSAGIRIGDGTTAASAATSIAIGKGAVTSGGGDEVCIGTQSNSSASNGTVVGSQSSGTGGTNTVLVGHNVIGQGNNIVIGHDADISNVSGNNCVFIKNDTTVPAAVVSDAVFIGDDFAGNSDTNESVVVGFHNQGLGGGITSNLVAIGNNTVTQETTALNMAVALGTFAYAANRSVAIGGFSGSFPNNHARSVAIGYGSVATGSSGTTVICGSYSYSRGNSQVVIGSATSTLYSTDGNNAAIGATGSVVIGQEISCTHADAVVVGDSLASAAVGEFLTPGLRMIRGTLSSAVHTGALIASFPLTVASSVVKIDATAVAITGANKTAMLLFRDYHFRNISGTVTLLSNIESTSTHDPDVVTGFSGSLAVAGTTIELRVTCTTAASFIGLMQVWGAPDSL